MSDRNRPRFFKLDLLGEDDDDVFVIDGFVEGIEHQSWRPPLGERLAPVMPENACIRRSEKYGGVQTTSLIATTCSTLFVSKLLKDVIERHCDPQHMEYLPMCLLDLDGRIVSSDYFIVNPIGAFDCLDFDASEVFWDDENPNQILDVEDHVLDRRKMKDAPQLFRVEKDPHTYVIGLELIREMKARDFSNVVVEALEFSDGGDRRHQVRDE